MSKIIGDSLAITDRVSECLIRIPVYYEITSEEQNQVVNRINQFFENLNEIK